MNALTIPPSPNWYESSILTCAPDNTLIFGARNEIVILENSDSNVAANVKIISRAHAQKVKCVNINKSWGQPRKLVVSVADDKNVKVWDAVTGKKLYSHNQHSADKKVIGASFAGDDRIISVSEEGNIIVWNLALKETKAIKEMFGTKISVSCLSVCPHASWLTAFGFNNGLVVVTDLRRNGNILYKMRGHDKTVISLSWCPVPINIFPKNPNNFVAEKEAKTNDTVESNKSESQTDSESITICHSLLQMYGYDEADVKYLQKYLLNSCDNLEYDVSKIETVDIKHNTKSLEQTLIASKENQNFENIDKDCDSGETNEISKSQKSACEQNEDLLFEKILEITGGRINESQALEDPESASLTCLDIGRNIVNKEEEEPRKEFLLASSAKENNIYIWRAGTDGRMQTMLMLPNKINRWKNKSTSDKVWISLCWISPTVLLSSSKMSELLAWTLPKPQDQSIQYTVIHNDHSSMLFSIAAPIHLRNEYNWKETLEHNAWTISQDRRLLNTSTDSRKNIACYPTIAGSLQCMQLSPLDPNRLAIGTSDGFVKFWDLSRPHTKHMVMTSFYNKIQSKVSSIAWHPDNELLVAFGTVEGRIGCLDSNNKSKAPIIVPQYFKSEVYKMEWAPVNGNKQNIGLYALAEGSLVMFDFSKEAKEPIEIDKPDNTFIYSFAWKLDYSLLLVVTKNGFLILYSPQLKMLCKHYFQYRINDILWHPNSVNADSKESNWLAGITNKKSVIVYNFDVESGNNDKNVINTFSSSEPINVIAWSPYESSQLVIACDVGVAQVWDVEKNEILATFVNPNFESITSVVWSSIDADFVICTSKDNTLRVWRISENAPLTEKEIVSQKKKFLKENTDESSNPLLPTPQLETEKIAKAKKPVKNGLLPKYYTSKNTSQTISDLKKLLLWKENASAVEVNVGDNCEVGVLNVFGSDQAMMDLVSLNETVHKEKGKYNMQTKLSLFRGDISTSIKEAIEEKRVNLGIISLAPMASPKLWKAACETYADQLSEEANSDPLEIATYYLACHNVEKAVYCLCDGSLFKEAYALAKCRMLGAEVVNKIMDKWIPYSVETGNFEVAAQCYIVLGKYEEAASVLFRRNDLDVLEFGVELAEKSGNSDLKEAVLFRYKAFKNNSDSEKDLAPKELPSSTSKELPSSTVTELPSLTVTELPSSTVTELPSSPTKELQSSTSKELPPSDPQGLPSSASQELPSSAPQELPSSPTTELQSSTSKELPSAAAQELPSSPTKELHSSTTKELPSSAPQELQSLAAKELPSSSTTELPSSTRHTLTIPKNDYSDDIIEIDMTGIDQFCEDFLQGRIKPLRFNNLTELEAELDKISTKK